MKSNRFNHPNFNFGGGLGRLIQDAFEGLDEFGGFFNRLVSTVLQSPRTELYEDDHNYFVVSELPGVNKSDLSVELIDGEVKINATVSQETADGRKNIPMNRSVTLPDQVGDGEINAKLENGILTVSLPKPEIAKPRTIEIE